MVRSRQRRVKQDEYGCVNKASAAKPTVVLGLAGGIDVGHVGEGSVESVEALGKTIFPVKIIFFLAFVEM